MRRILSWVGVAGAAFFSLHQTQIYHADLWWHLESGRFIWETKRFINSDIFSHTLNGTPWINFEWLAQVTFYLWSKAGFDPTLVVLRWAGSLIVLGIIVFTSRFLGARGSTLFVAAALAFLGTQSRLIIKPEWFTLVGLSFVIILFHGASQSGFNQTFRIVAAVVAMAIWANAHAGFVYGIGLAVCFSVGMFFADRGRSRFSFVLMCAVVFGACLTPYGFKISEVFLDHLKTTSGKIVWIPEYYWLPRPSHLFIAISLAFSIFYFFILEKLKSRYWVLIMFLPLFFFVVISCLPRGSESPLVFNIHRVHVFLVTLTSACLIYDFKSNGRKAWIWFLPLLVFAVWGFRFIRNPILFSVLSVPYIMSIVQRSLDDKQRLIPEVVPAWIGEVIAAGAILSILLLAHWETPAYSYPKKALEFLERENIQGKMFNALEDGGYITWATQGKRKVFMDGRYILAGINTSYRQACKEAVKKRDPAPLQDYFSRYEVDYALVNYEAGIKIKYTQAETPFVFSLWNLAFPRTGWALVYWDDDFMIFLKKIPKWQDLISKYEFASIRPYNLDQMRYLMESERRFSDLVEQELLRNERMRGKTVRGAKIRSLLSDVKARLMER